MSWQRKARTAIALFVVVFVAIVFAALRYRKAPPAQAPPPPRKDPSAVVENTGSGRYEQTKDGRVQFAIKFGSQFSYPDGRTKFGDVEITSDHNGKPFTISSREADVLQAGADLKHADFRRDVKLTSEATEVTADAASYDKDAGMLNIPGAVAFRRARMHGTGVGATYDFNRDVLWLLKDAHIDVDPDEKGQGALKATSSAAGLARADHYLKLTGKGHIDGEGRVIDADEITILLTDDDKRVRVLQLRGNSHITGSGGAGGPQSMAARDIDLTYADDGRTLQHATLTENAAVQLPGEAKSPGRKVSGKTIDIALAPDGKTVTSLNANENVQVDLPADGDSPAKRIRSATLAATGAPDAGLQNAMFGGNVDYRETRAARGKLAAVDRQARSQTLTVKTKPGFGAVEEADFHGNVHFTDGSDVVADSTHALYHVDKDQIDLTPSADPGPSAPRVSDSRVTVEARTIEFGLTARKLKADTKVRSSMSSAKKGESKVPSLLKNDQPVTVTSNRLDYDGDAGHAVYSGSARLWQGDTKINADTIIVDDKSGNLEARTAVHTDMMLDDVDPKTNTTKPTRSVVEADHFAYDDAKRLATYTGHAHLVGAQDVAAEKLELYLLAGANELDHAEGYGANGEVIVKENNRVATGSRLTYTAKDQTYLMTGTPVKVIETTPPDCKESVGAVLTFRRAADTIDLKGPGGIRTVSKQIACPSETR